MVLLNVFLYLVNTWMLSQILFNHLNINFIALTRRIFNYINVVIVQNFNKTRLTYCSFLTARYRDVLVIKMTFICKKKIYNAPKNTIRRNSMFSDVILLCVFSLKLYILAVFCKKHLFFSMEFCKTYCQI